MHEGNIRWNWSQGPIPFVKTKTNYIREDQNLFPGNDPTNSNFVSFVCDAGNTRFDHNSLRIFPSRIQTLNCC